MSKGHAEALACKFAATLLHGLGCAIAPPCRACKEVWEELIGRGSRG